MGGGVKIDGGRDGKRGVDFAMVDNTATATLAA